MMCASPDGGHPSGGGAWTFAASSPSSRTSPFGPFDLLSDIAHEHYLDGFSDRAVQAAAEAACLARAAGDLQTLRYLLYTRGVALVEVKRWQDAADAAQGLLAVLEPGDRPWRAKALSLLGDANLRLGQASRAVDALAEAYGLVEGHEPERYNDLSAAMAVATVLGHGQLFEPAEELFRLCLRSPAARAADGVSQTARVLVLQELAVLQASWAAALELVGDRDGCRVHWVRAAEVAVRMMELTRGVDSEMHARATVIEAFACLRMGGEHELACARILDATTRFEQRSELPEVQMAGIAVAWSWMWVHRTAEARERLLHVLEAARTTDRLVWEIGALAVLAQVEIADHGEHPALHWYSETRMLVLRRLWWERASRFAALRDRMSLRVLAAEATQLGRDALIDPLTGLGNRRMLDAGIAETGGGAVLFVDVDRFKSVNDRFTHAVGDRVLQRVADILRAHCRGHDDVVVRFGGDEFVVLLPMTATTEAVAVAERIRAAVEREPWSDLADGLSVSLSVGVSAGGSGSERVLRSADAALFQAKEAGRNRVAVG